MAAFTQINLVVRDMAASLAFYRKLGVETDAKDDDFHVNIVFGDFRLELDTEAFARQWNSGWQSVPGGRITLGFSVATREEVDALYARLVADGHPARQPPYDGFWGARYAIVDDPDGNGVGIMSPIDNARKFWPPAELPRV